MHRALIMDRSTRVAVSRDSAAMVLRFSPSALQACDVRDPQLVAAHEGGEVAAQHRGDCSGMCGGGAVRKIANAAACKLATD